MYIRKTALYFVLTAIVLGVGCSSESDKPKISYTANVSPILDNYCKSCHVAGQDGAEQSGFLVDTYESVMKGTKLGPVVVSGSAESSTLYRLVAGKADPSIKMPHGEKSLNKEEIDTIKMWIDQGAVEG